MNRTDKAYWRGFLKTASSITTQQAKKPSFLARHPYLSTGLGVGAAAGLGALGYNALKGGANPGTPKTTPEIPQDLSKNPFALNAARQGYNAIQLSNQAGSGGYAPTFKGVSDVANFGGLGAAGVGIGAQLTKWLSGGKLLAKSPIPRAVNKVWGPLSTLNNVADLYNNHIVSDAYIGANHPTASKIFNTQLAALLTASNFTPVGRVGNMALNISNNILDAAGRSQQRYGNDAEALRNDIWPTLAAMKHGNPEEALQARNFAQYLLKRESTDLKPIFHPSAWEQIKRRTGGLGGFSAPDNQFATEHQWDEIKQLLAQPNTQ